MNYLSPIVLRYYPTLATTKTPSKTKKMNSSNAAPPSYAATAARARSSSASRHSPPIPENSILPNSVSTSTLYPQLGRQSDGTRCLGCKAEERMLCQHSVCSNCACFLCNMPPPPITSVLACCSQCKKKSAVNVKTCSHCNFAMCSECAAAHKELFMREMSDVLEQIEKTSSLTPPESNTHADLTRTYQLLQMKEQQAIEQVRAAYRGPIEQCARALEAHKKHNVAKARNIKHAQSLSAYLRSFMHRLINSAESYLPSSAADHTEHIIRVSHESEGTTSWAAENLSMPKFVVASQSFEKFVLDDGFDATFSADEPLTPPPSPCGIEPQHHQHVSSAVRKVRDRITKYLPKKH